MAHKKAGGSTQNSRDSKPKYRGIKRSGGSLVSGGNIILRQVGTQFHAGENVAMGRDFTLYARKDGVVRFSRMGDQTSTGRKWYRVVSIEAAPSE